MSLVDCVICGAVGCVSESVDSRAIEYLGHKTVVNMYYQTCSECGSEYTDMEHFDKSSEAVSRAKSEIFKLVNPPKRYVVMDDSGRYYHFWDKSTYGEPQLSKDPHWAKVMAPQGCASAMRMLTEYGMKVHRVLWTPEMGTRESK